MSRKEVDPSDPYKEDNLGYGIGGGGWRYVHPKVDRKGRIKEPKRKKPSSDSEKEVEKKEQQI